MISGRVKKRIDRILAGLVSAAMTLTMVPEIWLPIHAQTVRDEIINEETLSDEKSADWETLLELDPESDEYAMLKELLTSSDSPALMSLNTTLNGTLLSNEYIALNAASSGRFSVGTTGGDPARSTDDNCMLTYGHPGGTTSYSTIRVDGASYVYKANESSFDEENGYNISSGVLGD